MHIAIICDPIDKQNAGIYQYTLNLVLQLSQINSQHQFTFITVNSNIVLNKVACTPLPNFIKFIANDPFRTFFSLPHFLNKLNPDIVIEPAHFGPFNLKKSIKRVTVIHDLTPLLFPQFHPFLSRFLQKLFLPSILQKADLILTNSEHTTHDVITYKPNAKDKTQSILLGKDDSFVPTINNSILKKYNIDAPYILSIGTLEPRKNLITLLNAFTIFKQKNKGDIKLVLAGGKGWKNTEMEDALSSHPYRNDIIQTGYIDREDMPALYSQCKAFVFPSYYEGFGLPLLEAMACGAPVIAANNSSLPEVGGDAALYFETQNTEDLAAKIKLISEDENLRNKMKEKSLIQANKFSWEKYAQEFMNILETKFEKG